MNRTTCSHSEYVFESNTHFCLCIEYWRNWWYTIVLGCQRIREKWTIYTVLLMYLAARSTGELWKKFAMNTEFCSKQEGISNIEESHIFHILLKLFLVLNCKYSNFCRSYNTLSPFWSHTSVIPTIWLMLFSFSILWKLFATLCDWVEHWSDVVWNKVRLKNQTYILYFNYKGTSSV